MTIGYKMMLAVALFVAFPTNDHEPENAWLSQFLEHSQAGDDAFETKVPIDLFYCKRHRRLHLRTLVVSEVDDIPELSFGRIPGKYPNGVHFDGDNPAYQILGQIGGRAYGPNGQTEYKGTVQFLAMPNGGGGVCLSTVPTQDEQTLYSGTAKKFGKTPCRIMVLSNGDIIMNFNRPGRVWIEGDLYVSGRIDNRFRGKALEVIYPDRRQQTEIVESMTEEMKTPQR